MNAKSFNLSAQGASHIKKNKECQDASGSYYDENMAIAIVCDGHGGDDYVRSAIGSKYACTVAERNIKIFLQSVDKDKFLGDSEKMLVDLEGSIINNWNQLIYDHYKKNPFTEEELSSVSEKAKRKYMQDKRIESAYGTTLIAVAMTKDFWFGIQIGDGKCIAVNPEGKFVQPIPWNEKCFLNATTSICDSDALSNFRHFSHYKLPIAVFVGSDGIDDCFSNNDQLNNLYKTIVYSFATTEFDEAKAGLEDYLPRLSAKGSGDDVSVAAILDFDHLSKLEMVTEYDREKEKARVEENARKQAQKNEEEKRRVAEEHAKFQQRNKRQDRKTENQKYCTECGCLLIKPANFCPRCGVKVSSLSEEQFQENIQEIQLVQSKRNQLANEIVTPPDASVTDNEAKDKIDETDKMHDEVAEEIRQNAENEAINEIVTSDNNYDENVDDIAVNTQLDGQDENKIQIEETDSQKVD